MRIWIAAIALASLTACGQPAPPSDAPPAVQGAPVPEEWRSRLTDAPIVARAYAATEIQATAPATVSVSGDGAEITTNPAPGAFSATLELGADGAGRERALRVTVQVDQGAFQLVSTYAGFPAGYTMVTRDVAASAEPVTIYLPVDENPRPVLVIANGSRDGASSGRLMNIELVTAP